MPPDHWPETGLDLTEGHKEDKGKVPLDLLSPWFLQGTAQVLKFGAEKYAPYNWAKGIRYSRVFSALQRHLWAWQAGEEVDEETNLPHLWHASCCLMFLIHYEESDLYAGYDDRPNYAQAAQTPSRPGDTKEELSGTRGFGGEDSQPTVTPESRDAYRVQGDNAHRPREDSHTIN